MRCALVLLVVLPTGIAVGQQPDSPVSVAEAVLAADRDLDWLTLLRLAHPSALDRFKASARTQVVFDDDLRELLGDCLPEAMRADTAIAKFNLDSVYQVADVASFDSLSPDSILARLFRRTATAISTWSDSLRPSGGVVLSGAVIDGDTTAFVVVRREWGASMTADPYLHQLMTLRRYAGEWRSMLDGGLVHDGGGSLRVYRDPPPPNR